MENDDQLPDHKSKGKPKPKDVSELPAQLGGKLRNLFADVEAQPIPDRLLELLDALAKKEKKTD